MFEALVYLTGLVCAGAAIAAYFSFRDVFHPMIYLMGMSAFMYVYMPLSLIEDGLFTYITEQQGIFAQVIVLLSLTSLAAGCYMGSSSPTPPPKHGVWISAETLRKGAYWIGGTGVAAWAITIKNAGGLSGAFGQAYGSGASDLGYIREAVYLLIVGLLLLLTPETFRRRNKTWYVAVALFATPWLIQGFLGARRGPTFVIVVTLAMGWFFARNQRPRLVVVVAGAAVLGMLMLFLVTNRQSIYLGSDFEGLSMDVTSVVSDANESNEYIFGTGCIIAANETGRFFWGRRYIAQIVVRPVPRLIWPTKYADFGVPELEQNAGVAGEGLQSIMGWREIPGSAAGMVADLWVEFWWGCVAVLGLLGWMYGRCWKMAVEQGNRSATQFVILSLLSIYLVTQSGEAVIFRFLILTLPVHYIWKRAMVQLPSSHLRGAHGFAPAASNPYNA